MTSRTPRLVLVEASKVRHYHSTLLDGMLRAYAEAAPQAGQARPVICAHDSFFNYLSEEARESVEYRPIPVMDQDRRRLIRKSLLEAWVTLSAIIRACRDDVVLVTTILPSAMLIVELFLWVMPGRRVVIMQHGELEGVSRPERRRIGSYGFYMQIWLKLRAFYTRAKVSVLASFIGETIATRWPEAIRRDDLFVIPLPMIAGDGAAEAHATPRACFIGFNTPNKGFPVFERLAASVRGIDFHVVGGGVDADLNAGTSQSLTDTAAFNRAVSNCDIAVFPYVDGYEVSLSAAATDAVACGLHLIATPRPCFLALRQAFGDDAVTICSDESEMAALLSDAEWVAARRAGRRARIKAVLASPFGLPATGRAMTQLVADMAPQATTSPVRSFA